MLFPQRESMLPKQRSYKKVVESAVEILLFLLFNRIVRGPRGEEVKQIDIRIHNYYFT